MKTWTGIFILGFLVGKVCLAQNPINGFDFVPKSVGEGGAILFIPRVESLGETEMSGRFVKIIHNNGRELDLFVPFEKKLRVNQIIEIVTADANLNNWPFFYVPFGHISIDSIQVKGEVRSFHSKETVAGNFQLKARRKGAYQIKIRRVKNVQFLIVKAKTHWLNQYNSKEHVDDGPVYRESKFPDFQFSETDSLAKFLLLQAQPTKHL